MTAATRAFPDLTFDRPSAGVLRITLDGPGLNAVDHAVHRQLADVWRTVDRDPDDERGPAPGRGQGRSRPAAASTSSSRPCSTTTRRGREVMREARDLVFNVIDCSKPIVSAMHGPAVGAGLAAGLLADVSVVGPHARGSSTATPASASPPATTPPSAGRCCAAWPRRSTYLLTCDELTGEEAERIGLVSLCVDDDQVQARGLEVAEQLAHGRPVGHPHGPSRR